MAKVKITRQQVKEYTKNLCEAEKMPEGFFDSFWKRILEHDDIYTEYVMYLIKGEFTCQATVEGYHIVDVMIWQRDHFKARFDEDRSRYMDSEGAMLLNAVDVFLQMREKPGRFIAQMQGETGIDINDPFFKVRV